MSLFPEITSINYEGFVDGVQVSYRYFVNDQNQWWYCYDDIIEFIQMNENYAEKLYDKMPDNEKEIFEDWNCYDKYGDQQLTPRRFVTSIIIRQLIQRNIERNNILIKSMNILEFREDAHVVYQDDEELLDIMNKTKKALEDKDYEEWAKQIDRSYHSESYRDIADKLGIINKEFEKAVDKIRDYTDEINMIVLEGDDSLYKLFKEEDKWVFDNWFNNREE